MDSYPSNEALLDITFAYPLYAEDKQAAAKHDTVAAANLGEAISIWGQRSALRFAGGKVQIILLAEDVAQQGLSGFLDYIQLPTVDDNAYVAVAVGRAAAVFQAKLPETEQTSVHIRNLLQSAIAEGYTLRSTAAELSTKVSVPGLDPILPRIKLLGEERISLDGAALFRDSTMVGSLSLEEMRLFMALYGKTPTVTLIPNVGVSPQLDKPVIDIEIKLPKTRITPKLVAGRLQVEIKLNGSYVLRGYSTEIDITEAEAIRAVTQTIEENLTIELLRLLAKLQELQVDPLGIGNRFRASNHKQYDPDVFRKQWAEAAIDLQVNLQQFRPGTLNTTTQRNN